MRYAKTALAAAAALAVSAPMTGCLLIVDDSSGSSGSSLNRVSTHEMDNLVEDNKRLEVGMPKADAMDLYQGHLVSLKDSGVVGDFRVEEFRIYAYDKRRSVSFKRWIYFVDGYVAEFSDERLNFREPDRVGTWAGYLFQEDGQESHG